MVLDRSLTAYPLTCGAHDMTAMPSVVIVRVVGGWEAP